VAAALLDSEPAEAEGLLERLVDAQLVEAAGEDQAGQLRYRLHDLLGVYGRERLQAEEPASTQQASLERVLEAYLLKAERADAVLEPSGLHHYGTDLHRGPPDQAAVATVERDPLSWLEAERASLVAAVRQAHDAGLSEQGRLENAVDCVEHSLALFRDLGYRPLEARALNSLGMLLATRGDLTAGCRAWHGALAIFRELGMSEVAKVAVRLAEPPTLAT
jgi:tetratricopeptide (TPR) repeat protein